MLGETAETSGLFLGCGMNSVGLASGGGAGMNLAHCIVHGHTAYDLGEADAKTVRPHLQLDRPSDDNGRRKFSGTHYDIAYPGKQLKTARDLTLMPLDRDYRQAGAHMGQFYGWERPLYFGKQQEPHLAFRAPRLV